MSITTTIGAATGADWLEIEALLTGAGLPVAGAQEHLEHFVCARQGERLVGVAGIEVHDDAALLRSVAVADSERGAGLGRHLVQIMLDYARALGLSHVGLLTTTAGDYFPRFGFRTVERSELPAAFQASQEFRGACPDSAVAMLLDLTAAPAPTLTAEETREAVRQRYAATAQNACCAPTTAQGGAYGGCCGGSVTVEELGRTLGYSAEELAAVPEGANLGLGCGNPQAIASIQPGETVVDLGSGAGFDAFLAARQVGERGRVIGVDMTPEMLAKARQNARSAGFTNVEFRLGEIEHLPVADQTVDVIISNCVINLSPEKPAVFREAFRVLKPGGRIAVSDMVTSVTLPPAVLVDLALYTGCIAGAASVADLEAMLRDAGFVDIRITPKESRELLQTWGADAKLEDTIFSAYIQAVRPA
ncbi:MAG TPA: arsenic resistance N-acetyltransferase ArsN2 [Symbiobacteriaceae bacterium]|nr:arsenic resistance N-acetyltransferase ArsN2 [Symbiobacteriaceae bacterium]